MSTRPKGVLVKVQIANSASRSKVGKASYRVTIPNLGVEYYMRIIHPDGKIELVPVEIMESATGSENGT
jgi:hypothetical protein